MLEAMHSSNDESDEGGRYIKPMSDIAECFRGVTRCDAGCDTVSFFSGRGKKTAWDVWNVFPELTPVLKAMLMLSENIEYTCLDVIERFVILLYDRITSLSEVNEVRQELFSRKARSPENIPLTQASLRQHVKSNHWVPRWTTLSQGKDSCYELIRCGCKAGCRGRCKCQKANLTCTGLYNCGGNCS